MKTTIKKTITSLLLITALCISGISYQPKAAEAADNYTVILNEECDHVIAAGETVSHNFNLPTSDNIVIGIYTYPNTTTTISIPEGNLSTTIQSTDPNWQTYYDPNQPDEINSYYYVLPVQVSTAGQYTLSLKFEDNTIYRVIILQYPSTPAPVQPTQPAVKTPTPSLSEQSVILTAGFSQSISTYNTSGGVTWSSNNNSVATVSNGKITGKKPGSTTISAKTASGYTMTCKVTVKKNEYSVKKASVSSQPYGKSALDIYKASYDKKGNLVLKARVLNNNSYRLNRINNLKIKIKTNNGKTIGVYSAKKLNNVNLNAGKAKNYTFKIKKSKLKMKKKADLRLMTYSISGKSYFIR